jgi:hypothetical protein
MQTEWTRNKTGGVTFSCISSGVENQFLLLTMSYSTYLIFNPEVANLKAYKPLIHRNNQGVIDVGKFAAGSQFIADRTGTSDSQTV